MTVVNLKMGECKVDPKTTIITAIDEYRALVDGAKKLGVPRTDLKAELVRPGTYQVVVLRLPGKIKFETGFNDMKALIAELHPPYNDGPAVDMTWAKKELKDLEINFGVDEAAIQKALDDCRENKKTVKGVLIAKGVPATRGEDAKIEFHFELKPPPKEPLSPAAMAAYLKSQTAMPGDVLVTKRKATLGIPGRNVFDLELPGTSGQDISIARGAHIQVRQSTEGMEEYVAAAYGVIQFKKNTLSVVIPTQTSPDKSQATIDLIPTSCRDTSLSIDHVIAALKEDHITNGILEDHLKAEISRCLSQNEYGENSDAARGLPPKNGSHAKFLFLDTDQIITEAREGLIAKGQTLCRKTSPTRATDGYDVEGEKLTGVDGQDLEIEASDFIDVKTENALKVYRSTISGHAKLSVDKLDLQPIVRIAEDALEARFDFYPTLLTGTPITADFVRGCLAEAGVVFGYDETLIATTIQEVTNRNRRRLDVIVARGAPAQAGRDGSIEKLFPVDPKLKILLVKPGETIAIIHPPTKHTPGHDVRGKELRETDGRALTMACRNGATIADSKDATRSISATQFGIITEDDDELSIEWPIQISDDEMEARGPVAAVTAIGNPIQLSDITTALKEKGVVFGIHEVGLNRLLKSSGPDATAEDAILAKGTPPTQGQEGQLQHLFTFNGLSGDELMKADPAILKQDRHAAIVRPGEPLVILLPPKPGTPGRTITNTDLPAPVSETPKLDCRENIKFIPDRSAYVSTLNTVGYVDFTHASLSVFSPFCVAPDKVTVTLSLYPPSRKPDGTAGETISTEDIIQMTEAKGIRGKIDHDKIHALIDQVRQSGEPVADQPIIYGTPPKNGIDEKLTIFTRAELSIGAVRKDASIDYRERGFMANLKKGDRIAAISNASKGENGVDVFGNPIPATDGKTLPFREGKNVQVLTTPNGREFIADRDGALILSKDGCSITDAFVINGDVDYKTGNIHYDAGALVIKGTVKPGFVVEAMNEIVVENLVDNATLRGQKRVIIEGGIIGDDARIFSGEATEVELVNRGTIISHGPVTMLTECHYATILSDDTITMEKDIGRVIGGKLCALHKIRLPNVGTDATSIKTMLMVGKAFATDYHVDDQIRVASQKLHSLNKKIEEARDLLDKAKALSTPSPQQAEGIAKLQSLLAALIAQREALQALPMELRSQIKTDLRATIEVLGKIYPGTVIAIAKKRVLIREKIEHVWFKYDEANDQIIAKNLGES